MNHMPRLNRRAFVVGTAAVGTGLALGFDIPFGGPNVVRAADGAPEVNAWVVIRPDDTVVIRIARSEMGQGTLTGLAQLVAEELDCDWTKVTTEYPTPARVPRASAHGAALVPAAASAFVSRSSMSAGAARLHACC
jgi:isoquinoline 1-oxidoreductase beta subunit